MESSSSTTSFTTLSHVLEGPSTSTQLSSSSLLRKDDQQGGYNIREEQPATLDESTYSVDSKGFMTWKLDNNHNHNRRGIKEESSQPGLDDSGRSHRGGGEEDLSRDDSSVVVDEEEKNDGGL